MDKKLNLDKAKEILQLLQEDTLTPKQAKELVILLVQLTEKQKEDLISKNEDFLSKVSQETFTLIQNALIEIKEKAHDNQLEVRQLTNKQKKAHESKMAQLEGLIEEFRNFEIPEIDEEGIIQEALSRVPKEYELTGENVVDSINSLEVTPENQIDAKHIKNLPSTRHFGGSSGIKEIVAGTNVTVDNTNPQYPIVSSSGGGGGGAVDSVNGKTGVVVLTKSDVGLGNVDNTSDVNKPISTATQTALNALVPYTGATANLDLGTYTLTTPKLISSGNLDIEALTAGVNIAIHADGPVIAQSDTDYVSLRAPSITFSTNGGSTFGSFDFDSLTADRAFILPDAPGTFVLSVNGTAPDSVGNVTITVGDALTSNPLSQFASTTSTELAGVISDETGSGSLVFADTPTLTSPVISNSVSSTAGSIERDAKVFYSTPVTSARGVSPSVMYAIVGSAFNLATATGVQSAFPTGYDVWTLEASTTYYVEGFYYITKATTALTTAIAFALGGGASITSMRLEVISTHAAVNTTGTANNSTIVDRVASTVVTASSAANAMISFKGHIRMNAGGTVTPQIAWSTTATATPTMAADSYIKFTPIGTNTVTKIGNVA